MTKTRLESDSMGSVEVAASSYWGAQTQRSIENFPFGPSERMPIGIVHALAIIKQAAARVNRMHGLDAHLADAIDVAAGEVIAGHLDEHFPLVIWQTGSGTQSNMNVNEVIAGRANEILTGQRGGKKPVHPNDHVNQSQSSNDCFPTAMHIAAARAVADALLPDLTILQAALEEKARQWRRIVKKWSHPSAGCNAPNARPGIFRLCPADWQRARADRPRAGRDIIPCTGRHCGWNWLECA